jgi:pyruvate formate lyase activating enzyme
VKTVISRDESVFQKEALLYTFLSKDKVQCNTCNHNCTISEGKLGVCKTRINKKGRLYCVNYGLVSTFSINPIEKKPLFHYFPGTYASTVGSFSCNFKCPWCQNWSISKVFPYEVHFPRYLRPEDLVKKTEGDSNIDGISMSFNEPTLSLEYALDTFRLCNNQTYRMFVTNGYMTTEALELLIDAGMTGMSITVKGGFQAVQKYCKTNIEKVWSNIRAASNRGVHIEVICLIIPNVNDSEEFFLETAKRLKAIDNQIPLHFTRFFPDYQFTDVNPTPVKTLEKAHQIAYQCGLKYVYLGNVYGHPLENTYCPNCKKLLIKRTGYNITTNINKARCPNCNESIPIYC